MDELTRERYGPVIPYAEQYATPTSLRRPKTSHTRVKSNRVGLCGTDDLTVLERGGSHPGSAVHRRVLDAIRRWKT